jgi:hypothetical protein
MNALQLTARRLTVPLRWFCLIILFALVTPRGSAQVLPNIVTQPQSQTNTVGTPATFYIVVSSLTTVTYNWRFNGTNIPNATNDYYTIPSVQFVHAGTYSCTVTNSFGNATSSNAILTVLGSPVILTNPANATRTQGQGYTFSVVAAGEEPLDYQWRYNNTNFIADATNTTHAITNIQVWQAGVYSVTVANGYGAMNSSNALLNVTLPSGSPACWGNTAAPASTVPPGLSAAHKAVAAGGAHTLGLKTNNVVTGWGDNTFNQLGLTGLSNVTVIAAGLNHSLALLTNGSVVAVGDNDFGQTQVPFPLIPVTAIAAGANHNLALLNDNTVLVWGSNLEGETNVPPDLTNVVRIAAGFTHNIALKRDGTVTCWGSTNLGECDPPGGLDGVIAIAAGNGFSLALRTNGAIVGWGDSTFGRLSIPAILTNGTVVNIAAGSSHCLALREGGQVVAWGENTLGATNVPNGVNTMSAISGGSNHCVALRGSGAPVIACAPWGMNVDAGSNVTFAVFAAGNGTLRYQWRLNGTNVSGATNKFLNFPSAQTANAGPYTVTVSNSVGVITSSVATLTVVGSVVIAQPVWSNTSFDGAGFHARLTGTPGPWVIATSPNLLGWTDVLTTNIPPAGYIDLIDGSATRSGNRYYRAHTP